MILFLKIVAGCVVAIVLVIAVVLYKFRKHIKQVIEEMCAADTTVPLVVHLHEDLEPDWKDEKPVKQLIAEFEALDFTQGKAYFVDEMEDVTLLSLFHEKFTGVIYVHEQLGCIIDIVHSTPDEQFLTGTTAPDGGTECPPNMEKVYMPKDTPVAKVLQTMLERCTDLESVVFTDDNFRHMFEKFYKMEQSYRIRNGGTTYEEFTHHAEQLDQVKSEKHMREAFILLKTSELEQWTEAASDEYCEQSGIDEDDRRRYEHYLIVPKKTDAESYIHYLSQYDLVHYDHAEKVGASVREESDIGALFEKINKSRSPDLRAVHCGTVNFPIEAEIYKNAA